MLISLGDAPQFVWWFIALFLLAVAGAILMRAYAVVVEKRGNREIGLAAIQSQKSAQPISQVCDCIGGTRFIHHTSIC